MSRPRSIRALLAAITTAAASLGLAFAGGGTAQAATPLPTRVFAPYFEAWTGENPATLSQQSGAKYLTMAFLQTATAGSCTPYWNGDTSMPVSQSVFGADITTIRSRGGDVIPSFGGYTADTTGTELADSCTNVNSIALAWQNLITTYDLSRIDLDIEADSIENAAGVDRRNKAIKQVQTWAAANGRSIQFSYTLPSTTHGLAASGVALLRNAVTNGAKVDVVNIMAFDFYDNQPHEMATDAQTAAAGLHDQLAALYPAKTSAQIWAMIGVTVMPGVDDFGPAETFTTADATTLVNWAASKNINTLSMWALQRDNGNCPGGAAADNCSGIAQDLWQFSHTFQPFTGGGTATNDFSVGVSPGSGSVAPGSGTSATVDTAVTNGAAQNVALTVTGAPNGVTATLNPTSVTAGGTATLDITTTTAAAPGAYPLTITGTGPSATHTTAYTLTVTGGPDPGGVLVNGDLESGALAPWACQPGGSNVATPAHGGTHALQAAAGPAQTGQCTQTVTLTPNSSHTLTAWVRGNYAYLGVSGGASGSTWASPGNTWTKLTVPFTVGANGSVTVYLHGWYAQGSVYGDDFAIS
jgi:glycosyl hydrolase family 18 (putative chitinase)/carbohydrate binding protein with CBM4/9 domain